MRSMYCTIFVTCILSLASISWSSDDRFAYRANYDFALTISLGLVDSDNKLNYVYQNLYKLIDAPTKEALMKTQREWMEYRDKRCVTKKGIINIECHFGVNSERFRYLRDRLIECEKGNCRNDAIIKKSWN